MNMLEYIVQALRAQQAQKGMGEDKLGGETITARSPSLPDYLRDPSVLPQVGRQRDAVSYNRAQMAQPDPQPMVGYVPPEMPLNSDYVPIAGGYSNPNIPAMPPSPPNPYMAPRGGADPAMIEALAGALHPGPEQLGQGNLANNNGLNVSYAGGPQGTGMTNDQVENLMGNGVNPVSHAAFEPASAPGINQPPPIQYAQAAPPPPAPMPAPQPRPVGPPPGPMAPPVSPGREVGGPVSPVFQPQPQIMAPNYTAPILPTPPAPQRPQTPAFAPDIDGMAAAQAFQQNFPMPQPAPPVPASAPTAKPAVRANPGPVQTPTPQTPPPKLGDQIPDALKAQLLAEAIRITQEKKGAVRAPA